MSFHPSDYALISPMLVLIVTPFQATLYKIAQTILAPASDPSKRISDVRIALPNKHYIPVNMSYIGVDNMTPYVSFVVFSLCTAHLQILYVCGCCVYSTERLVGAWHDVLATLSRHSLMDD